MFNDLFTHHKVSRFLFGQRRAEYSFVLKAPIKLKFSLRTKQNNVSVPALYVLVHLYVIICIQQRDNEHIQGLIKNIV